MGNPELSATIQAMLSKTKQSTSAFLSADGVPNKANASSHNDSTLVGATSGKKTLGDRSFEEEEQSLSTHPNTLIKNRLDKPDIDALSDYDQTEDDNSDDSEVEEDDPEVEQDDSEVEEDDPEVEQDDYEVEQDNSEVEQDDSEVEQDDSEIEQNDDEVEQKDDFKQNDNEVEQNDAEIKGQSIEKVHSEQNHRGGTAATSRKRKAQVSSGKKVTEVGLTPPAKKKQKVSNPSVKRQRNPGNSKLKTAKQRFLAASAVDTRPLPWGEPEIWADVSLPRQ